MIRRIINNDYFRNLAILLIYISPDILQHIAAKGGITRSKLIEIVFNNSAFYLYFVFHNRVLYEKLFLKKKYIIYAILFLSTLFIWRESSSYAYWLMSKHPGETVYHIRELEEYNWKFWVFIYWANIIYIYIALGVYIAYTGFRDKERLLQIENEKKSQELKQLNEQLNPHFLFNALNNIYSYLLNGKENGKELVMKLSELMRYVLDISKKDIVPVTDEINFIENYMAFEQERLGDRCRLEYVKQVNNTGVQIASLIIFNFIENAFKHGTVSIYPSVIVVKIKVDNNSLELYVSNPVYSSPGISTQLGMNNTRRRLELLYPGQYDMNIIPNENSYTVSLKLTGLK